MHGSKLSSNTKVFGLDGCSLSSSSIVFGIFLLCQGSCAGKVRYPESLNVSDTQRPGELPPTQYVMDLVCAVTLSATWQDAPLIMHVY